MRRSVPILAAATALTAVVTAPAAAGGGGPCRAAVSVERVTEVSVDHVCWSPVVARVAPGTTVTFTNGGGLPHNLSGPGPVGMHDLPAGATVRIAFPAAGVYPFSCSLHPQMAGAIVVGDALGAAGQPATPAAAAPATAAGLSADDSAGGPVAAGTAAAVGASAIGLGLAGILVRRRAARVVTS